VRDDGLVESHRQRGVDATALPDDGAARVKDVVGHPRFGQRELDRLVGEFGAVPDPSTLGDTRRSFGYGDVMVDCDVAHAQQAVVEDRPALDRGRAAFALRDAEVPGDR
jgi:hypothetical protein